jgi:acyl-CoA synthetase (AMP-forming)/AMP-acid ligase II
VILEGSSLWSLIDERANRSPDALIALDEDGRRLTFGEYRERALRVAAALAERGIGAEDRVSWQLPTWIETAILAGALSRLGAVQNPIIPILREREVGFITRQVHPRLIVVPSFWRDFDYGSMAESAAAAIGAQVLICDRTLPEADPGMLPPFPEALPDAVRWILYTSGTTSDPKGALHSDASLSAGARGLCEALELGEADRWAMVAPFTHVGGVTMLLAFLMTGASGIFVERYDDSVPALLGRLGCTVAAGGTALVLRFLEVQRRAPSTPLFPELRATIAGAAPKPDALHEEVRREMGGLGVLSVYGLTEAPYVTSSHVGDGDDVLAACEGRPAAGTEVRIVGSEGQEVPLGESGELRVRGALVCQGYLDPALDREAFDDEGFFRTGDLARMWPDRSIEIVGRLKDVIIRNGENISPKEIEDLLYRHPAIVDAAVIGLPDPRTGERCCAVVVAANADEPPTLAQLVDYCRDADLANQKLPEQLVVLDELPRNAAGKVLKFRLCEELADSPEGR